MKDIQLKLTTLLLVILGICVGLSPNARATDIDGVLSNGNNAACVRVLVNLTNGAWNSGFGFQALNRNTTGRRKTASGINALYYNETRSWTRRVKENITPMGEASETIFALKPVTFWYKKGGRSCSRNRTCSRLRSPIRPVTIVATIGKLRKENAAMNLSPHLQCVATENLLPPAEIAQRCIQRFRWKLQLSRYQAIEFALENKAQS